MIEESAPRRRGRPATGVTPKRNVRIGETWVRGEKLAQSHGMTMTAFVEEALRREITRVEREDRRKAAE